jgi:hypothetical protein
MPEIDSLAFDIRYALTHGPIGRDVRKFLRALPDRNLEYLCCVVADHLRLCRWRQLSSDGVQPSAPCVQGPKD